MDTMERYERECAQCGYFLSDNHQNPNNCYSCRLTQLSMDSFAPVCPRFEELRPELFGVTCENCAYFLSVKYEYNDETCNAIREMNESMCRYFGVGGCWETDPACNKYLKKRDGENYG